jgi:hypothetical protein
MEREKLVDIWFVFRIWEFEMTGKIVMTWDASQFKNGEIVVIYGDFIYVFCVCVGMLENFKL